MQNNVIGILAHVDAGKTTLSESMLFLSGKIRKLGRVDNRDAFLDTYELEKMRGITIFAKQARLTVGNKEITLLDTPGHVDFSAEMERTLSVLDYAILVISGADGVQSHTLTLWTLLKRHEIPTFIFINKLDQPGVERLNVLEDIHQQLSEGCILFDEDYWQTREAFDEEVALRDDGVLDHFLEQGKIDLKMIRKLIKSRKIYPVFSGSALKLQGIEAFMNALDQYTEMPSYPDEFAAVVYKVSRQDNQRLTHLKVTGGKLTVKMAINTGKQEEKINEIRLYSGEKYDLAQEVQSGTICAVTGLNDTLPGNRLGAGEMGLPWFLEPVLSYRLILPPTIDERRMMPYCQELMEEMPECQFQWHEATGEILVKTMGEIQLEILKAIIKERFDLEIDYGEGHIIYKETLAQRVEGVGHFEPLRHYAEVHLLMEPLPTGSGIVYDSQCSEDLLDKKWQRLVMTHVKEKTPQGVTIGAPMTDIKITLVAGRGHIKHTEGGDFREATYRALRQGFKEAGTCILEPYYNFKMVIDQSEVGRAMTDVEKCFGTSQIESNHDNRVTLTGRVPVATFRNYHAELRAYTKGLGQLYLSVSGYDRCHNPDEVANQVGYDSERDVYNPTGSVFCAHGSGYLVPWNEVKEHMHIECQYELPQEKTLTDDDRDQSSGSVSDFISLEEIDEIIHRTSHANEGHKSRWKQPKKSKALEAYYSQAETVSHITQKKNLEKYLLVDGYNIIFAWEELNRLAKDSLEAARMKLMDILSDYHSTREGQLIVVFDAYKVKGRQASVEAYHNIHMIYTKEAQTADEYIEKFAHDHQSRYQITVATSDGLQQVIIRGAGSLLMSARELYEDVLLKKERQQEVIERHQENVKTTLGEIIKK